MASHRKALAMVTKVSSFGVLKPHSMLLMYLEVRFAISESVVCVSPLDLRTIWIRLPTFSASMNILLTASSVTIGISEYIQLDATIESTSDKSYLSNRKTFWVFRKK